MSGKKISFLETMIKGATIGVSCVLILTATGFSQDSQAEKQYFNMGIKAQADQDFEKAAEYFQKSLETEGESTECLNNLGSALHNISKKYVNEAYKYYKKSLADNPKNEVTLEYLGSLYISQMNLAKAQEMLNALKKMESTEAETLQEKMDKVMAELKKMEVVKKSKK